ncbi:MAG: hypothetical protein V3V96_15590 [Acidiferrobacterales bacterium]
MTNLKKFVSLRQAGKDRALLKKFVKVYKRTFSIRCCVEELGLANYHIGRALYLTAVSGGIIAARPRTHMSNEEAKIIGTEEAAAPEPIIGGRVKVRATPQATLRRGVTRFMLSCAQNNTELHEGLWENWQALAKHYKARMLTARSVYNRFASVSDMDKKLIIGSPRREHRDYVWDKRLTFHDERLELAPGLVWCGETNVMPTAPNPLAGFETFTGRASTIIPHPRIAMRSVSTHKKEGTKLLYTTGTLTQRNYIQRKAGQMAEFHHCYGGLLVEVDRSGVWFVRQLNADSDGTLHDWDVKVKKGHVSTGNSVRAISWGDIHAAYGDPVAYKLAWGEDGMLDELRPSEQFIHDLLDFRARNPHRTRRALHLQTFQEWVKGHHNVEQEVSDTADFLAQTLREWCKTIVVDSNHDNMLVQWLSNTGDFRKDPENAVYFLQAALHLWERTSQEGKPPNMTQWAVRDATANCIDPTFLDEDESYIICPDANGGIECGLHGHESFNGARGGPRAFSKIGRKANIGHHHSAGIWDGVYVAGIMGKLDQGYNTGLGSWSQSNIITYENGKRTIQTIYDGKARA